jgi:hypothetical protein
MGTFYGNQIMRTREAAHRVLIEPSLGDPCTALCVIDRVPKPRAASAAASLSLFQPDYALYFAAPAGVINLWALIELGFLRGSLGRNRFGVNPTGIEVPPPLPAG